MRIRGPGNSPCSIAIFTPRGVPPASRTLVNPASSVFRALSSASRHGRLNGVAMRCSSVFGGFDMRWTWQSIMPGITVMPLASMTSAPRGIPPAASTAVIRPPSITIVALRSGSPPLPSMSVPQWMTVVMCFLPGEVPQSLSHPAPDRKPV